MQGCQTNDETQDHVLQACPAIHPNDTLKVQNANVFDDNANNLKLTADKIGKIMEILSQKGKSGTLSPMGRLSDPATRVSTR